MNRAIVEIRRNSGETNRHWHSYHQILLPYSGSMEIEVDQRGGYVAGNIGAFVAAGRDHSCSTRPAGAFVILNIPADGTHPDLEKAVIPAFFSIGSDIQGLIDYMIALDPREQLSAPLLTAWSSLVLNRLADNTPAQDRVEIGLRRAVAFMTRRFADRIRVADIAKAAGMSPTGLHAAFQQRRSSTPYAQLMTLRLDAAERLLADPRLSIAEVALRTGHADQSALTRVMQRERGSTPADFRRRVLGSLKGNA